MKKNNLFSLLSFLLLSQVFYSCNTTRHYEFSNSAPAYHSGKIIANTAPEELTETLTIPTEKEPENLTASTDQAFPVAAEQLVNLKQASTTKEVKADLVASGQNKMSITKAEKKELKQLLKQTKKQNSPSGLTNKPTVDIVELIFAILLPPVGVLLHDGGISTRFWISLVLTLLFFFPGMIYALLVVTDTI